MKINGLVVRADGTTERVMVDGLEDYQRIVGGYIEHVGLPDGSAMYVNEEGKIHGLPINDRATEISGLFAFDVIYGDVLVLGPGTNGGDDTSVSDALVERIVAL